MFSNLTGNAADVGSTSRPRKVKDGDYGVAGRDDGGVWTGDPAGCGVTLLRAEKGAGITDGLTPEDGAVLSAARREGKAAAWLFEQGDFSESGFLLYGRLERLCARGLLRFESWTGDGMRGSGEMLAVFLPVFEQAA
jgi:hypothetical protein